MKWNEPYDGNVTVNEMHYPVRLEKTQPIATYSDVAIGIAFFLSGALFTTLAIFIPMTFEPTVISVIIETVFIVVAVVSWVGFLGLISQCPKKHWRYVKIYNKIDFADTGYQFKIDKKWLKYGIYQDAVNEYYAELRWAFENDVKAVVVHDKWVPIIKGLHAECQKLDDLMIEQAVNNRYESQRDFAAEMKAFSEAIKMGQV